MSELTECPPGKKFSVRFSSAVTSVFLDADEQQWETIEINQKSDVSKPVKYRVLFMDSAQQQHTEIPASILDLKDLEELHLEMNHIEVIPKEISHFHNIKVLYLNNNNIIHICDDLEKLKNLQSLDLSSNPLNNNSLDVIGKISQLRELRLYNIHLEEFPVQLCKHLHHLQLLGLSNNRLKSLPPEVTNLIHLREIYLQNNAFTLFPVQICALRSLEVVDLEKNKLTSLPVEIGSLRNLIKLFIGSNKLSFIPKTLCQCKKLAFLDLSGNRLYKLPHAICELKELKELVLSDNQMRKLSSRICQLHSLSVLYLKNTGLSTLPAEFAKLDSLKILDLSQNCFTDFPLEICGLKLLQVLSMDDNLISTITPEVRSLENLSYFGITGNRFTAFPEEVLQLESLEKLYIGQDHGVQLSSLPDNIFMLKGLKELYIENNNLEFLPSTLNLMHNLEVLDCHNNNLKKLPDNICQLYALQKLLLQNNQLTSLPDNLDMLHKLDLLLLDGNPLVDPPVEVCSLGTTAVWEYLKEKRKKHAFATKIQALWRGLMVRKGLGPFAYLLQTGKKGKKSKKDKKGKGKGKKDISKEMSMISDQEGKHLYQLTGCIPTAELRQKQEIMMRNQMMSVNPQVVVPVQQRMPVIPTQFDSRLLDRGEMLPSNDLIIPNDARQMHLASHFGSSVPGHSGVMSSRPFSAPGYSNFLHTEPLDFVARRQELLQKQNLNRMDMEINAMYHQREMEKSHRKGFIDMDTPFLYHGMPSNPVAFRGRQMCQESQLPSDLFVHRNALDILHGSTILKTSPYTPINSLQRERSRRPGRRAGNPKIPESNMGVPKIPTENKPQSSPSATEEEKEEKKEEDTEAFNRCDQGKVNTESATDKTVMETQDNPEKTSHPIPSLANGSRTGADKELTNPGTTFEDRYIYQSPVHLSTSPFSFPVTMNPSLLPGAHSLFLNRDEIPPLQDIRKWSSQDVYNFVSGMPGCSTYAQVFKDHDIDGVTLPLLTEDHLLDTMGLKLGPALKIRSQICCRLGNIFHMPSLPLPGPVSSAAPVPPDQPPEVISPTTCSNSNTTAPSPCAQDSDTLRATDTSATENKENPCDLAQTDFPVNLLKV